MTEIVLGVLLDEVLPGNPDLDADLDETGHVPASGRRGAYHDGFARRVAVVGDEVLRAVALAVGREVASVLTGVVAGIEECVQNGGAPLRSGSFDVGDVELKFGVKATLGAGKVVGALLTASGEATVEVTVKLHQRSASTEP